MMLRTALWLTYIANVHLVFGLVCPPETGAVFFMDHLSNRNDHCFEHCSYSECTGVIQSSNSCVTILADDYFGTLSEKEFIRKHCVQDVSQFLVMSQRSDRLLLDNTIKIEKALDQYHCLSLCAKETKFVCLSVMFYNESGDCLLNSANSDTVALTPDSEGFSVSFMERRLPKPTSCSSSFNLIPHNARSLHGEARLHNISTLAQCLQQCKFCDYVLFHEVYNECFIVKANEDGQPLDFLDEEYQVLENLCSSVMPCSSDGSMYIANLGNSKQEHQICLQSCMSSYSCSHAYYQGNNTCAVASVPFPNRTATIERLCSGIEKVEADATVEGILFEELDHACPSTKGSLKIKGIDLTHCFSLCLTHPTKSCEAVSYYPGSHTCHLLNKSSKKKNKPLEKKKCQYFNLNIISLNFTETAYRSEGEFSKDEPSKYRAHSSKTFRKNTELLDHNREKKENKVNLKTICQYDRMIIKLAADRPLDGHLFARNSFENCSTTLDNIKESELIFFLNETDRCGITKKNHLYEAVIVLKESLFEESGLPIITESDRMFSISCDYGNGTKTASVSRQLALKGTKYNKMEISGKVPYHSKMTMELRSKRQHEEAKVKTVSLGQPLELVFEKDVNMADDYIVSNCIATGLHSQLENITLIENGCPKKAANEYIVQGDIQRTERGFILPLRAFRFRNGDTVRIACALKLCKEECEQPSCRGRNRRNLPTQETDEYEDVLVTMRVEDEQKVSALKEKATCMTTTRLYAIISLCIILLTIELSLIIFMRLRKA